MAELSKEHKKALARGRRQAKAVRDYLEALEADRSAGTPGRPSDPDAVRAKIADYQQRIHDEDDSLKRVELIQKRLDSEDHLEQLETTPDLAGQLERFVQVAKEYSERKGITYTAWREMGVPASVLKSAGIPRTRRTA